MKSFLMAAFLLFCWIGSLQAQDEKVEHSVSEEEMDTTLFKKLQKGYNYVIRADKEETRLFKFDVLSTLFYPFLDFEEFDTSRVAFLQVGYEQKIKPNWSWAADLTLNGTGSEVREIVPKAGVRYYYNMNKRILKGKSANNFSANYISPFLQYNYFTRKSESSGMSLNLLYGIQRRLGKFGYFDFHTGLSAPLVKYEFQDDDIYIILDFRIGLAF